MTIMSSDTSATPTPTPRVAVIGSGLAGLTTAYLLRLRGVTVYLIEKSDKIGFHSSSVDVPSDSNLENKHKRRWTVDVPMRSFQGGYYPNLIALYRHLEIPLAPIHFTFSFSHLPSRSPASTPASSSASVSASAYFIHSGASGLTIPSFPSTRSTILSALTWLAYAGCYVLLLALAALSFHSILPCLFAGTLGEMVDQIALFLYHPIPYIPLYTPLGVVWKSFIHQVVIPLFSSVGTMPASDVYDTPAKAILDYIHQTVGTHHYALGDDSSARTVAERLSAKVKEQAPLAAGGEEYIRLGTSLKGIRYDTSTGQLRLVLSSVTKGEEELEVDKVVLATPASVARSFLTMLDDSLPNNEDGTSEERSRVGVMTKALSQVRYKQTIVVTHTDRSVLPVTEDVRDINLVSPPPSIGSQGQGQGQERKAKLHFNPEEGYTQATHVIRHPQQGRNEEVEVYQTTNPMVPIDPTCVLGTARLERALPLRHPEKTITALHPSSSSVGSVYLAGAYAWPGIPLLEGCVGSAQRVVDAISRDFALSSPPLSTRVDWDKGKGGIIGRIWRWRRQTQTQTQLQPQPVES